MTFKNSEQEVTSSNLSREENFSISIYVKMDSSI